MKRTAALITLALAAFCRSNAQEQFQEPAFRNGQEIFVKKDTNMALRSFSGKNIEGKTSLAWVVSGLITAGTFLVYRSGDGMNYEIIGLAQSAASGSGHSGYNFTDCKAPFPGAFYYQLVHLGMDNTIFMSQKIKIEPAATRFAAAAEEKTEK